MSFDDIRARHAAATPGNWSSDSDGWIESDQPTGEYVVAVTTSPDANEPDYVFMPDGDREFIVHAPSDVARLLAAVDRVRELHREEYGECAHCINDEGRGEPYPCTTLRALDGA